MKREITEYDTNKLDTLKFISWCKYFLNSYEQHKFMLLPDIAMVIWRMIQQDVFNVTYSETGFNKLINDIGYLDFYVAMYRMGYIVKLNEKDYIYDRNFKGLDNISLIGEPIYKFMHKIEEMLPDED